MAMRTFSGARFGARVAQAIDELGLTDDQFLRMTGLTSFTLRSWRNGERSPYASSVAAAARALNVSCDWLMGITDTKRGYGQ